MKLTRPTLAAVAAVAALTLAGCGAGGDDTDTAADAVPVAATGSLEQLAAQVKCEPNMQTDADELRQAICKTADGKYILLTFATDRGQREWINGAKDYGGHYLVGRKWIAVGETTKTVETLRKTLGGDIEEGIDHSGGGHTSH
ncbi:hypothetical protein IAG44_29055 [Streptomyces roseirectus]|uniref:Lipoprotein n=1 Tax=Streptomyces roseirectus TaxID=2768066 RepID=A0A7H0IJW6_9ACTN|nr:hypothetical protein [Streptomyces roseirectus]QNP73082.1 hypothetical protein IAG44_29055 [Streptomyces roseirectus]